MVDENEFEHEDVFFNFDFYLASNFQSFYFYIWILYKSEVK